MLYLLKLKKTKITLIVQIATKNYLQVQESVLNANNSLILSLNNG